MASNRDGLIVAASTLLFACGGASDVEGPRRGGPTGELDEIDSVDVDRESHVVPCPEDGAARRRDVTSFRNLPAPPTDPTLLNPATPSAAPATPQPPAPPVCGDRVVESVEDCDDGNTQPGDGCDALCSEEAGFDCPSPGRPCVRSPVCGDAVVDPDENCEDGNANSGDGCSARCVVELGYRCPAVGRLCEPVCGDLAVTGYEQCEDGNVLSGDGCSDACLREPGFECPYAPMFAMRGGSAGTEAPPTPAPPDDSAGPSFPLADLSCIASVCGNGVFENGEACDDGNDTIGDGCALDCSFEPTCSESTCVSVCGDAYWVEGEACDDGNTSPFDGCDAQCVVELGFTCDALEAFGSTELPFEGGSLGRAVCTAICGDALVVGAERCDDGAANGDGYGVCSTSCTRGAYCGDGMIDGVEYCDNGINDSSYYTDVSSCGVGCQLPGFCGDSVVDTTYSEECDLGVDINVGDYAGCTAACEYGPRCGDGIVQPDHEECDDGNLNAGDGCGRACNAEAPIDAPTPRPAPNSPPPGTTNDVFVPDAPAPAPTETSTNPCR